MSQLNLFKFFKVTSSSPQVVLPSPDGPLSREIPSTAISAANDEVKAVVHQSTKKRGCYAKFTLQQKAIIGNYALINGPSAAICHYVREFPDLKYTTVCDWRKSISAQRWKERETVTELHGKKRGRPPTLPEEMLTYVMKYIHAVHEAGGVINTAIVIGATSGIVRRLRPELLECNGGSVVLPMKKDWAKYLLSKMKFVKRKATTKKSKVTVSNFDEIKEIFLMDIKAVVVMEEVPDDTYGPKLGSNGYQIYSRF